MGNDCMLSFTYLTDLLLKEYEYFIAFFFFKVDFNKYTIQCLWDILKMMLFTKYFMKWNRIGRNSWKFQYWFNLKSSMELDTTRIVFDHMLSLGSWRHTGSRSFNSGNLRPSLPWCIFWSTLFIFSAVFDRVGVYSFWFQNLFWSLEG